MNLSQHLDELNDTLAAKDALIGELVHRLKASTNILATLHDERRPKHRSGDIMPKGDDRDRIAQSVLFQSRAALDRAKQEMDDAD